MVPKNTLRNLLFKLQRCKSSVTFPFELTYLTNAPRSMTVKDRTSEFSSVVQSIKQSSAPPSTTGVKDTRKGKKGNEKSQFFIIAAQIGKDISETAEKLDRLTKCKCHFHH